MDSLKTAKLKPGTEEKEKKDTRTKWRRQTPANKIINGNVNDLNPQVKGEFYIKNNDPTICCE